MKFLLISETKLVYYHFGVGKAANVRAPLIVLNEIRTSLHGALDLKKSGNVCRPGVFYNEMNDAFECEMKSHSEIILIY